MREDETVNIPMPGPRLSLAILTVGVVLLGLWGMGVYITFWSFNVGIVALLVGLAGVIEHLRRPR